MKLAEYSKFDGVALAKLVRCGDITPKELAKLSLSAIAQLNPKLNAVLETYPERALGNINEDLHLPLAGVPMLLKDTGTADQGKLQACGSRLGVGYRPAVSGYLTEYYAQAGLNILGRSAMPELAQAATTESALNGPTCNPWDLSLSTGGSSGGAAAAVASGMVPIAHGTDTGGSIRIPAACCGLVGLKPTRGRISKGPMLDETLYGGLNTEHVVTRSVRDTAIVLEISCHPGIGDPFTVMQPSRAYTQELCCPSKPFRIAFTCETHTGVAVDPVMVDAVNKVANILESLGHILIPATPSIEAEAYGRADSVVWAYSTAHEIQRLAQATGNAINAHNLERPSLEALEFARGLKISDWFESMATYNRMSRTMGLFFDDYDLLLTPTVATLAPSLGSINSNRDISYDDFMVATINFCPHTAPFNVTGQPAISLPLCISPEGFPIGIQLVAGYGREDILIQIASLLEEVMPWNKRIPSTHAVNSA